MNDNIAMVLAYLTRKLEETETKLEEERQAVSSLNDKLSWEMENIRRTRADYNSLLDSNDRLTREVQALRDELAKDPNKVALANSVCHKAGERLTADKLGVIKDVREATGWDLKHAKDFVEAFKAA